MPLLIFDCDGVLVDSEYLFARVACACLAEAGVTIAAEGASSRFAGVSVADILKDIEREHGRPLPADLADRIAAREDEAYRRALEPIPGVREAILALDLPRCVASSSLPERIDGSLATAALDDLFEPSARFSTAFVVHGKPAPDIFLSAARAMGEPPETCIVVEDSVPGVTGAVAAGMRVIGFAGGRHCGRGHGARLSAAGAQAVIAHMRELQAAVERLTRGA